MPGKTIPQRAYLIQEMPLVKPVLGLRTGWTRVYIDRVDQGYLSCKLMENILQYSNRIRQCTNSYQCFEMLKIRIKNPASAGLNQWLGGDLNSRPWGYESHALTS